MWKNFLGKKSKIIGVDANPKCKYFDQVENGVAVRMAVLYLLASKL